jgi:hypothetical protein
VAGATASLYLLAVMTDHKDFHAIETETWQALEAACAGPRTPLTWFSLATVAAGAQPQQRTVVLRGAEQSSRTLTIYTDVRTPKVTEISATPSVACLFFNPETMHQYRLNGTARVLTDGPMWQAHWSGLSENGKRDYASLSVPGEATGGEAVYDPNLAKQNFAVIEITCETLDWLKLARGGHQRAQFDWRSGKPRAIPVTP